MDNYKKRVVDHVLIKELSSVGAVLIEGPKWCGKTTTASQIAKSILYMQKPDERERNIELANINPSLLLQGEVPRLIDEWQLAPKLWDAIRFEVDQRDAFNQFILTGSSIPIDIDEISHTGTGRISRLQMRTMSLYESLDSTGDVSLSELFKGNLDISGINNLDLNKIAYLVCRGGWPKAIGQEEDIALRQSRHYYDAIVNIDISKADNIKRDPETARQLLRSYARNVGSQATIPSIIKDISINNTSISDTTVNSYLGALRKIFVIEESIAWNPNLRSRTATRTSNTRYFIDPSIGVAALGINPSDLVYDLQTMGFFFENLCIRDLRVYADYINGKIYHYRDRNGLECDAIVHLDNGSYGLVEIKLGGDKLINDGIQTLTRLEKALDTSKMKAPSFKMVLTGTGSYAYRRKDGILIVPIGCLKY